MIVLPLLLHLGQTAAPAPAPALAAGQPEKWSIMNAPDERSCAPQRNAAGEDIVVCAEATPPAPIPYPDEAYGPRPSNPYKTGAGALEAESSPCATIQRGCQVGFGPPIVPMIKGLVDVTKRTFAKTPDKRGRVTIPLDDTPPPPSRIEP